MACHVDDIYPLFRNQDDVKDYLVNTQNFDKETAKEVANEVGNAIVEWVL